MPTSPSLSEQTPTPPMQVPASFNADALERLLAPLSTEQLLRQVLVDAFPGKSVVTTSFGAESAVILSLIARIAPETPVVFLDTGYLFAQTLSYRDRLISLLGLTNVQTVTPDPEDLQRHDPTGDLHKHAPDKCCYLRKELPLQRAISGFDVWISGRKRFHGGSRSDLPRVEFDGRFLKINPLADWSQGDIVKTFADEDLPHHPLVEHGFTSIGCFPCTEPTTGDGYSRAGRWSGSEKTECGIHNAPKQRSLL